MILTPLGSGKSGISETYKTISQYNQILKQSTASQLAFFDGIKENNPSLNTYLTGLNGAETSLKSYITASTTAQIKTMLLTAAYTALNVAITMGVSFVIQGITKALIDQAKATEDAISTAADSVKSIQDETAALENQKKKIIDLRTALAEGNLSQEEANGKRKDLLVIQNDLIAKYGKEAEGIDTVTGSIEKQIDKINELTKANAENWIALHYGEVKEASDYASEIIGGNVTYGAKTKNDEFNKVIRDTVKSLGGNVNSDFMGIGDDNVSLDLFSYNGARKDQFDFFNNLFNKTKEYQDKFKLYNDATIDTFLNELNKKVKEFTEDNTLTDALTVTTQNALETLRSAYTNNYNDIIDAQNSFNTAMASGDQKRIDKAAEEVKKAKDNALKAAEKDPYSADIADYLTGMVQAQADAIKRIDFNDLLGKDSGLKKAAESLKGLTVDADIKTWSDEQKGSLNTLSAAAEKSGLSLEDLLSILTDLGYLSQPVQAITYTTEQLEAQKGEVDKLFESLKELSSVMEQVASGQEYSTVQILDVISKYPELIGHITATANGYTIQKTALEDLMRAEIEELKVKSRLKTSMAETNFLTNGGSKNAIDKYTADISSGSIKDFSKYSSDIYTKGLYDWMLAKTEEIAYDKFTYDAFFGTGLKFGNKSTGSSSNDDPYKDKVEADIKTLQHKRDMDILTEIEYYNQLEALVKEKYTTDIKYLDDYQKYEVEIYKGKKQLTETAAKEAQKLAEEKQAAAEKAAEDAAKAEEERQKKIVEALDARVTAAEKLYAVNQDELKLIEQLTAISKSSGISDDQKSNIADKIQTAYSDLSSNRVKDIEFEITMLERQEEKQQEIIDLYKKMQEIVHEEAERLRAQGYQDDSDNIQSLKTMWFSYADAITKIMEDAYEATTQNLKESLESQSSAIQDHINSLQEDQSNFEKSLGYVVSVIDDKIAALEEEKRLRQENNDEQDREIERIKLVDALMAARNNKNVRIYDSAKGFYWSADEGKISEAQSALNEFDKNESLRKEFSAIDDRISAWNDYKKAWQSISSDYETSQNSLIAAQVLGAGIESDILNQRTAAVETFGQKYIATLEAIKSAQNELTAVQEQISSVEKTGSLSSGSSLNQPIAYSSSKDYQAEINTILQKMANATPEEKKSSSYANYMEQLWALETQRNSKIKQKKLPYAQTSLYGGNTYANGTLDSGDLQIAKTSEFGAEMQLVPAHSMILPAGFTDNIWKSGFDPVGFTVDNLQKSTNFASIVHNRNTASNDTHVHINSLSLPNVTNYNEFVKRLTTELQLRSNVTGRGYID